MSDKLKHKYLKYKQKYLELQGGERAAQEDRRRQLEKAEAKRRADQQELINLNKQNEAKRQALLNADPDFTNRMHNMMKKISNSPPSSPRKPETPSSPRKPETLSSGREARELIAQIEADQSARLKRQNAERQRIAELKKAQQESSGGCIIL